MSVGVVSSELSNSDTNHVAVIVTEPDRVETKGDEFRRVCQ